MKPPLIPLLVSVILQFGNSAISSAAVPLKWTVETSAANPATFDQFAGATYDLEATLQSRGKPLAVAGDPKLYWQTNGMGSAWWTAPATVSGNVLRATWTPACDVGARVYNCFIGITGTVYNAAFQLRLRPSPGALPNELPLPTPVIDFAKVTVLNPPWSGGGGSGGVDTNAVLDIIHKTVEGSAHYTPKYLWVYDCDDTYPEDAAWYYAQPQPYGSCSAVRDGGFLYRNYDWRFDSSAEFVVRMSAGPAIEQSNNPNNRTIRHRFASVGVANCGTNLTEAFVTSGKPSRYYKCLPGRVVDGINENGVVCEVNVVDGEPQWRSGVLTASDIHPLAAVRWALDNGTSAGMVASNLAARIMFPSGWTQNFHWMVADERETWIVENGAASNVTGRAVMTNFRLYPTRDPSGAGQERYDLLLSSACCITNAWFTRAYRPDETPPWVSDLAGLDTNLLFRAWAAKPKEAHRGESFDGQSWWQTVHSSVYDITNRTLRICVQETPDWYVFAVPSAGGVKPEAVREIVRPMIGAATNGLRRVDDMAVYEYGSWSIRIESTEGDWYSDIVPPTWNGSAWVSEGEYSTIPYPISTDESATELRFVCFRALESATVVSRRSLVPSHTNTLATSNGVDAAIAAHHDDTKATLPSYIPIAGGVTYLTSDGVLEQTDFNVWDVARFYGGKLITSEGNVKVSMIEDAQSKITASGLLKGDGDGNVTAATPEDIPTSQYLRVYDSVRHCWMRGYMVNGVMQWEVE